MYNVRVLDFKCNVPGVLVTNEDGSYTIFINDRMGAEKQKETYLHELEHIEKNDFQRRNVNRIESEIKEMRYE